MEIEKKLFTRILFIISFITYSSFVLGLPNIEINEEIPNKSFEKPQHKFDPNIKILFKSVAYPANMIDQSFNDFSKIGSFVYQLESKNLNNSFINLQNNYKLVEINKNKYMISNGSLIIKFKERVDRNSFNKDYSLISKYEMGIRTAYYSKGFDTLNFLMKQFILDERVLSFELDLIDPELVIR